MSSRCAVCGCDVDPTLDPARVLDDGHIATLCRRCIRETREVDEVELAATSDTRVFDCSCGERIELWRAVTAVRSDVITLECPDCAAGVTRAPRDAGSVVRQVADDQTHLLPAEAHPEAGPDRAPRGRLIPRAVTSLRPRARPLRIAAIVAACAATTCLAVYSQHGSATATSTGSARVAPAVVAAQPAQTPVPAIAEVAPAPAPELVAADPDQWVYPLPGLAMKWETTRLGTFGSKRDGRRPRECHRGHCGVDLHGPRGMPIVAVGTAIVDRVHRSRSGRSGRYVELLHDDGSRTYYMHLDHVRRNLRVGTEVVAGEAIGTLGRTGIRTSPAHLHFAWKIDEGEKGRYKNPAKLLAQSRMIPTAEVRAIEDLPQRKPKKKPARKRTRRPPS